MLKKTIKYNDYNGNERTDDLYFNISEAELTEMSLSTAGGYYEMLTRIIQAQDIPTVMKEFKNLILSAYGEKSPDGKRFIKSTELATAFSQTEAYSILFMELMTDATKAADFANGILPKMKSTQQIAG